MLDLARTIGLAVAALGFAAAAPGADMFLSADARGTNSVFSWADPSVWVPSGPPSGPGDNAYVAFENGIDDDDVTVDLGGAVASVG